MELIARLNRELGIAVLYISHDLLAVSSLCHRVAILHEGKIVESGPVRAIFAAPQHPFTKQLVQAIPSLPGEAK
jgi:ABC-type dipeptide/oligopeptide/nickel transport system ATPase component